MKWTVEFSEEEVRLIAQAVSVAFVDKEERARVVALIFKKFADRGEVRL